MAKVSTEGSVMEKEKAGGWRSRAVLVVGTAALCVAGAATGMALGAFWALPATSVEAAPVQQPQAESTRRIIVDARVLPIQQADLSFATSGLVADVLIGEGDEVTAGQLIARLNNAQQQTAVSRAQAELQRAQARLDQLLAGARPQEVTAAQAVLAAAQARLERIQNGALPGEIAAAEAALSGSQAALQQVLDGPTEQQLIAARAEIANAEVAMARAQAAYDLVKWRNDIGALPESAALQQATIAYEAAQARLRDLEAGARVSIVDGASANVRRAQAQLTQLRNVLPADATAAEAEVQQVQAQLELLMAGARPEEVSVAEAEVAAATAALQQALVSLADTELRAPFAGTVALVQVNSGEQVVPGQVAVRLADLSRWEIRTEDLTELDVIGVQPGDRVTVSFDAVPGLELGGQLLRIRPIGTDQRGDIVYTAVIALDSHEPRLLWNMTAVVELEGR
jgi:HlyD family secretion protein